MIKVCYICFIHFSSCFSVAAAAAGGGGGGVLF
jgi:hypothetical protein